MGILSNTLHTLYKKPLIFILTVIAALPVCYISQFNPVPALFSGFGSIGKSGVLSSVVSLLQFLWEPDIFRNTVLALIAVSFLTAVITSLYLPGYFNILNHAVLEYKGKRRAFGDGFRRFFTRILLVNLRVAFVVCIFVLFSIIALVPALVLSRAVSGNNPQMFLVALVIDVITAVALYFALMFLRVYILYWYSSIINGFKKPFRTGKCIADSSFWRIFRSMALYDIFFVCCYVIIGSIQNDIVSFLVKLIFYTMFFSLYFSFIFNSFKINTASYKGTKALF